MWEGLPSPLRAVPVTHGQVVLDCIRKQTEQVMSNKPVSSVPLWAPLQFLLTDGLQSAKGVNPSLRKFLSVMIFITAVESKPEHEPIR